MQSRILIVVILLAGIILWQCSSPSGHEISWTQERATAISISKDIYGTLSPDSVDYHFAIRLSNSSNNQNMLGNWSVVDDKLVFNPVISFSRGYTYELLRKGK